MIFRLTVNPRPKPTLRVVKNGAGAFCAASAVKAGAVVLNFDLQVLPVSRAVGIGVQRDADFRLLRIRLKRVEHDFSQRVFERGAVAGE